MATKKKGFSKSKKYSLNTFFILALIFIGLVALILAVNNVSKPKDVKEPEAAGTKLHIGYNKNVKVYDPANPTLPLPDLGDLGNTIFEMVVYNGKLFVGLAYGKVLSYDKSSWVDHGVQSTRGSSITSMAVYNNKLYIGIGDGVVKSYDGTSWVDLGDQGSGTISLKTYAGKLYAGDSNGCIKSYNGSSWKQIGCLQYGPHVMEVYNRKLYIGESSVNGRMYVYDAYTTNNTTPFIQVGNLNNAAHAMKVYQNKLYATSQKGNLYVFENNGWTDLGEDDYNDGILPKECGDDNRSQTDGLATDGNLLYMADTSGDIWTFDGTKQTCIGDWGPGVYVIKFY